MAGAVYGFYENIKNIMNEKGDPRVKDWPFMNDPLPLIILSICYLYFVCKVGPQYMKDRKPYNLKKIITVYNTCQILVCAYFITEAFKNAELNTFGCENMDYSMNPKPYKLAKLIWWTMILKISEYLETIFFVLRKKQNQVSRLHLYHHVSTLSFTWTGAKFFPGEPVVLCLIINSIVHFLMYSYYLAALYGGEQLQKRIMPLKKSLTILQMAQFTVLIIQLLTGIVSPTCKDMKFQRSLMTANLGVLYYMFFKFYKKSYKKIK